jgi:hypothetical protein
MELILQMERTTGSLGIRGVILTYMYHKAELDITVSPQELLGV